MAIVLPSEEGTRDVDTGLTQVNQALSDPPLGDGIVASRVQVIPLAPVDGWLGLTHGQPYLDPITNTVHVVFAIGGQRPDTTINVLFWDPHTIIGPGEADPYAFTPPGPQ
jgi:hypothetical protein